MYLVSKESIGNCRSSSDFNENLMKIHKKIRKEEDPEIITVSTFKEMNKISTKI